jgi:hypothetical protein
MLNPLNEAKDTCYTNHCVVLFCCSASIGCCKMMLVCKPRATNLLLDDLTSMVLVQQQVDLTI